MEHRLSPFSRMLRASASGSVTGQRRRWQSLACAWLALAAATLPNAWAQPPATAPSQPATLEIVWPVAGSVVEIGEGPAATIGVLARSSYTLKPAGQCGDLPQCGHLHMKIDPQGDDCNLPGQPSNSMNSDVGGELIKAHFGACPNPQGEHVIGILLADDRHQPVLVGGQPVTALVKVTTRLAQ